MARRRNVGTREEVETVITWTMADQRATVYSLMGKVWRQCQAAGGEQVGETYREGQLASKTYLVDPDCIRIRPPRTLRLSPEAKRERLARFRSPQNNPGLGASHASELGKAQGNRSTTSVAEGAPGDVRGEEIGR